MSKSVSNSREQQLEELKTFINAVNKEITDIVGTLGWTVESITNSEEYVTCTCDSTHRLKKESLDDHLVSCQWKTEGYEKSAIPLSESTLPADSPFSIKLDKQLQNEILRKAKEKDPTMQTGMGERLVPRTSDRLLTDFTSDERKALYDYVVANTTKPEIGQDIEDINKLKPQEKKDEEVSLLELLMQERNLKRRRAKHKSVHTNKKSHIEILREVINQQMEIYTDYICEQNNPRDVTNFQNTEIDESNQEIIQNKTGYSYKKELQMSSQNYDLNFKEKNSHHYSRKDLNNLRDHSPRSEKKSYHRSREKEKWERYTDKYNESYRKHRRSSPSRDRKSHKKEKHRSRERFKDKHCEKKHKSRDRNTSSERHYTKHSDHKRKHKKKEY